MKKGDIYLIDLASSFGHEQFGLRPAIIVSPLVAGMIVVIPLTTNLEALCFPYTLSILLDSTNNLTQNSVALVFQIKSIDQKRIKKKIGSIPINNFKKLNLQMKKMLKL
ncbi:MAG: type II toxin-antitoxin system PemK/MazF family toxin [Candidatus Paceibacterota bacterium]